MINVCGMKMYRRVDYIYMIIEYFMDRQLLFIYKPYMCMYLICVYEHAIQQK
jgi:hypothetical protein